MKSPIFLALAASLFLFSGCAGYHIGARIPKKMAGVETIAVPTFHNETLVPRLESLAASTLVKQFQQDGTFAIRSTEDADVILTGSIDQIRRRGARSVRSDIVKQQEFYLTVAMSYTLTRRYTGEMIDRGTVTGETSFFVTGNDINQDERQAIPLAIEKAAVNIVGRVTTGW
ncbi:MAG: LPS assembly lipoprotein LptE [Verrucomicrobia bacterium]|nr:LPS assembly lipoprotein LptE [Verrucomicrobiota bacterium]